MDILKRLKPNHLRLVMKIAETGQLQLAAGAVAMSQPAASRVLGELETQTGGPLFERHPKGMAPTPLGAVVMRHAKVILAEYDALEMDTRRLARGDIGKVSVGAVSGPAVGSLMPAIHAIKSQAPDLEMTIEVGPSSQLVRGLVEGRFDFVISRLPPEYDSRDFRMNPARSEEVSLLVRRDHPLSARPDVSLQDMADFDWVVQELGSPIRQAVDAAFHTDGLESPPNITNTSSLLIVLSMLENSNVIAPQSREVADMLAQGPIGARLDILRLNAPITISPCFIIQNRGRQLSGAAERLLGAVFNHL